MKVGTDGVLLGAWVGVRPADLRMLDIGTGTGLIALMLAQRTERFGAEAGSGVPGQVRITGVDAEEVAQARQNADASPWGARMTFEHTSVQVFRPEERYDLIVSNPPYFVDSLTCPDHGRTLARHAVSLPYGELCEAVVRLLAPGGRFAVILPTDGATQFLEICRGRLALARRTDVRTTPRHGAKRALMEFTAASAATSVPAGELVVGTGEHEQYTPEYRALTRDFYLKF